MQVLIAFSADRIHSHFVAHDPSVQENDNRNNKCSQNTVNHVIHVIFFTKSSVDLKD